MKSLSIGSIDGLVHLLYPTYCLHCDGPVKKGHHLLCSECFSQIEWIDRSERCPSCWGPAKCNRCFPLYPHRSLFEPCGPILPLYQEFLKTKRAEILASLIIVALNKTPWPLPDLIVPLTEGPFHKGEPSYLLAKKVGGFLSCKALLPSKKVRDKTVLLFTDRLSQVEILLTARSYLKGFFPAKVYSMALLDLRS